MSEPGYKATGVGAYAVVGGSSILVSTGDVGTHCSDTVSGSWDKKAGDWELPFYGRADFFREYGAWIGFSAQDNRLCYSSGLGDSSMQRQPELDMVWDDPTVQMVCFVESPQTYTHILNSQLVHLGSGKLCVARLFERVDNELIPEGYLPQSEMLIVLTGLVLKASEAGRGIEMIPNKSLLYRFDAGVSNCWLF